MAPRGPIQDVEVFHLLFLRAMETRVDRKVYVVKGGVNLRAWFGSARCSEDLDLDVVSGESYALRERIDALLASPAFQTLLKSQELHLARISKPKQTETTQRWKFEITGPSSRLPLHTKVEFSRRGSDDPYALEPARSEVVRPYGLLAPTVNHYTASSAVRQKIAALAGRKEPQARDVWDLAHLFRTTAADPRPLPAALKKTVAPAIERVFEMGFQIFRSQVVPFLKPEHQELYGTPDAWDRIRESVVDRLEELRP